MPVWAWLRLPVSLPLFLGQRFAPLFTAVALGAYVAWGSTPELFGVVDVDPTLTVCAAVIAVSAFWTRLRPVAWLCVTVGALGLSMTLLWQGSPAAPRELEMLKACLLGTLWLAYLSIQVLTEYLAGLRTQRERVVSS